MEHLREGAQVRKKEEEASTTAAGMCRSRPLSSPWWTAVPVDTRSRDRTADARRRSGWPPAVKREGAARARWMQRRLVQRSDRRREAPSPSKAIEGHQERGCRCRCRPALRWCEATRGDDIGGVWVDNAYASSCVCLGDGRDLRRCLSVSGATRGMSRAYGRETHSALNGKSERIARMAEVRRERTRSDL